MEETPRERYTEQEIRSHMIEYKREAMARLDTLPFLDNVSVEAKERIIGGFHVSISDMIDETRRKAKEGDVKGDS